MTGKMRHAASFFLAAVMTLSLAFSHGVPVYADGGNITIESVEDLEELAKNCKLDTWSQGKTVTLTADLDLTDSDFTSIPTFGGTFDGGGHTISGLSYTKDGSTEGFFRYIQEGAVVRNLRVEGILSPTGTGKNIGGIAGSNSGAISSCTFAGTIEGETNVGGIAGINEASGSIYNSAVSGTITGIHSTGGVAGRNLGQVMGCTNSAEINTGDYEEKGSSQSLNVNLDTDLKQLTNDQKDKTEVMNTTTDTGGVCGYSSGSIQNSSNQAAVGYPHIGYNVGGIAGRSEGYLSGNQNQGDIQGRKDVGGIVGQMAPDLQLHFDEDKIETLRGQINKLSDLVDTALSHMDDSRSDISGRMDKISDYADTAKDSSKALADKTTKWADSNLQKVNQAAASTKQVLEDLTVLSKDLQDISGAAKDAIQAVKNILDTIAGHTDEINSIQKHLTNASSKLTEAAGDLQEAIDAYQNGNTTEAISKLTDAVSALNEASGELNQALQELQELMNNQDVKDALQNAVDALQKSADDIQKALQSLRKNLEQLGGDLSKVDLSFDTLGDGYREEGDRLYAAVGGISHQLERLGDNLSDMTSDMVDDFRGINDQFQNVMNSMLDIVSTNDESDSLEDRIVDVSDEEIEKTTRGKAYACRNSGEVEGDVNVGGIAGSMAIEYDLDPEDDITKVGSDSLNFTLKTRAIIQNCVNQGEVTSKKDNAGGIAGNMALGLVVGSESYGSVLSTNGNYVGGIAGYSVSLIRQSYAKCTLEGGNYVGGIAGWGKDIRDCYSLIEVTKADEYMGAIAGDWDGDGTLSGNRFVGDDFGGVDGISYGSKAEPVDFDTVAATGGIPAAFLNFELRFVADGEVLKTVSFEYGDDLSDVEYPDIPKKDGYNGKWEEADLSHMTFSKDLNVLYTTESTAVASDQMRDLAHSTLLAEGTFSLDAKLVLAEAEEDTGNVPTRGRVLEQWTSTLRDPVLTDDTTYKLRFIAPEMKGKPGLYRLNEDGSWKKLSYQKDGSYLVFNADSAEITFCVTEEPGGKLFVILLGALAVVLLAVVVLIRKRRKKKKDRGEADGQE